MMKYLKTIIVVCLLAVNCLYAMDDAFTSEQIQRVEYFKSIFNVWKNLTNEDRLCLQKTLDRSLFGKTHINCKEFVAKYENLFPSSFIDNQHLEILEIELARYGDSFPLVRIVLILIINQQSSDFVPVVQITHIDFVQDYRNIINSSWENFLHAWTLANQE